MHSHVVHLQAVVSCCLAHAGSGHRSFMIPLHSRKGNYLSQDAWRCKLMYLPGSHLTEVRFFDSIGANDIWNDFTVNSVSVHRDLIITAVAVKVTPNIRS